MTIITHTADSKNINGLVYKRIRYILLRDLVILVLGVTYAIFIWNTGIMIPCLFRKITGWKCPGCGITGACMALLKGHFTEAFSYNPFLFIACPVIAYLIVKSDAGYIKNGSYILGKTDEAISYILIALAVIFTVLRNIF